MAEKVGGQHRDEGQSAQQRAEEGRANRKGHGGEQPSFHSFEREQRNIGGDQNAQREEYGTFHLERGLTNRVEGAAGARCSLRLRTIPESSAPRLSRFAGTPLRYMQMNANSSDRGMARAVSNAAWARSTSASLW